MYQKDVFCFLLLSLEEDVFPILLSHQYVLRRLLTFLSEKEKQDLFLFYLGHVMRKPAFCTSENIGADQLNGNRAADHRLCFLCIDSS